MRGDNEGNIDDYNQAIEDFSNLIKANPTDVSAIRERGWTYIAKKEYDSAIQDFTTIIQLDDQNAVAYYGRGRARYYQSGPEAAIPDFLKAVEIDPGYVGAWTWLGDMYMVRNQEKDLDLAIEAFTQAIEIQDQRGGGLPWAAWRRPVAYYLKGEYANAIADLTAILDANPDDEYALPRRGECYYLTQEYDKALVDLTRDIDLRQSAWSYYHRGRTYKALGEQDRAISDLTYARDHPGDDERLRSLAVQELQALGVQS